MNSAIVHQIVWTLISFLIFYSLMNQFVFKKAEKISKKRSNYIARLKEQFDGMEEKTRLLEEVAHKILYEELPLKEAGYVKRAVDHILNDLETEYEYKKQLLQEKLHTKRQTKIDAPVDCSKIVDKLAKELMTKI